MKQKQKLGKPSLQAGAFSYQNATFSRRVTQMGFEKDLDTPLLRLLPEDTFSARDGAHVFGSVGAGKTSSASRMLAETYLRADGGYVTAKSEEVELWRHYAQKHGRGDSILLDESEEH
jgi:hypothetical protein